jgi:hypothetical protein
MHFQIERDRRGKGGVPTMGAEKENAMLKSERDALLKLCRQREKVAKSEVSAVAARRKADFERQLAAVYAFDQSEVWTRAVTASKEAWRKANEEIACEAVAMGIPREFAPSLCPPHWFERGQNAVRERRAELTRVAYSRIEEAQKHASLQIERSSLEFQTRLLAVGLESTDARALLENMPTPEQLMPSFTVEEIQNTLNPGKEPRADVVN